MKNIPYDNSRCRPSQDCADKERCARFTSPGNPDGWQSHVDASALRIEGKACGMFIDNEKDNK